MLKDRNVGIVQAGRIGTTQRAKGRRRGGIC